MGIWISASVVYFPNSDTDKEMYMVEAEKQERYEPPTIAS